MIIASFAWRVRGVLAFVCGAALLPTFGCNDEGSDQSKGSPASNAAAGTGTATPWTPLRADDDGVVNEPDWLAACDIGDIEGACDWVDDTSMRTGSSCLEWAAGGLDLSASCGADYVFQSGRCSVEGVVAVCVSQYGRTLIYDSAKTANLEFACKKVCRAPDAPAGDGSCDQFLRCVCGSVEPRADDDSSCTDARSVIATQRKNYGEGPADTYCANLLALEDLSQCGVE